MSVSVMKHGRLWGLVIGHHRQPLLVPPALRTAVTLLVDAFAMRLTEVETAADWDERRDHVATHARLLEQMAGADDFVPALTSGPVTMADLFDAGGAAVIRGGEVQLVGETPPPETVLEVVEALHAKSGKATLWRPTIWRAFPPASPSIRLSPAARWPSSSARTIGTPCCGSGPR